MVVAADEGRVNPGETTSRKLQSLSLLRIADNKKSMGDYYSEGVCRSTPNDAWALWQLVSFSAYFSESLM